MNDEHAIIELTQSAKVNNARPTIREFADALARDPESDRLAEEDKSRHAEMAANECAFGQDFDPYWKVI